MKNTIRKKDGLSCPNCPPPGQTPPTSRSPLPGRISLSDRLALRPKELAAALGVGERTVRALLPEIPHLRLGGVILIPVKPAERWLEEQVKSQRGRTDAVADEILGVVTRDND
jgi:hypothetical protein